MRLRTILALATLGASTLASANILLDGGFDAPALSNWTNWGSASSFMNVYHNTGGNGFNAPSDFGNFTGVTAASGQQFVAGLATPSTAGFISQTLQVPLVAGQTYRMSALLHAAVRSDLDLPGTYTIALSSDTSLSNRVDVGVFAMTVNSSQGWVARSVDFVAPTNAANLTTISFISTMNLGQFGSYTGLDSANLEAVPEPMSMTVLGLGTLLVARRRRRK